MHLKRKVFLFILPILAPILLCVIVVILHLLRPLVSIRFLLLSEYRIGGFVPRADYVLRHRTLPYSEFKKGLWCAVIEKPANRYLFTMLKRYMPIYQSRIWGQLFNYHTSQRLGYSNALKDSRFVYRAPYRTIEEYELYDVPPVMSFTKAEEDRGKKLLSDMGIPMDSWFVCFHAREAAYFADQLPTIDHGPSNHRNCSIANYLPAMEYIAKLGGYAIRVGSGVRERIPNLGDDRIIDYAYDYRSDFGDIYLAAKCKFFVGCNSGLTCLPLMFNVPVVDTNSLIMPVRSPCGTEYAVVPGYRDIFLPRPILATVDDRLLTLPEILQTEVSQYVEVRQYSDAGFEVMENSSDEILSVVKEMNLNVDGEYIYTDEDNLLQRRFQQLIRPAPQYPEFLARIGSDYLRANLHPLDQYSIH